MLFGGISPLSRGLKALLAVTTLALPAAALAAPASASAVVHRSPIGSLAQLPGKSGCLADRSTAGHGCTPVRALRGPGLLLGSDALAISPNGHNVYVASSLSNSITVFNRSAKTGKLRQAPGAAGCIAAGGAHGCASAVGLDQPNSVAVSADGKNVYATSLGTDSVEIFSRDASTGALTQASDGSGCIANAATTGCTAGRALDGADIVAVSPDGENVYVGAFFGNAVAVFDRDPSTGALTQPSDSTGCIVNSATAGCTTGLALGSPEGLAVSRDGNNVYAAAAASNAVATLTRDPSTGALSQASDGTGCITDATTTGCTTGVELRGADAVAVSPDDGDIYVTALFSNSLTSFTRTAGTGQLTQKSGTAACVIYVLAVGCSLGRGLNGAEGVAVAPGGASVYAAAYNGNAIVVLDRNVNSGAVIQTSGRAGCVTTSNMPDCRHGRALKKVSSLAVSPGGKYLYAAAFGSNAVTVFKRIKVGR